jgi:hypothetical protein
MVKPAWTATFIAMGIMKPFTELSPVGDGIIQGREGGWDYETDEEGNVITYHYRRVMPQTKTGPTSFTLE